jgi:hypothetical protein
MYQIQPICEEAILPHVGRHVCAVLRDGTRHYGFVRGIADGRLYLEPEPPFTLAGTSVRNRRRARKDKIRTKAFWGAPFGGFGFGAGLLALDLALIGLLFLTPFFFI